MSPHPLERAVVMVLDSCGAGEAPDAAGYGDSGSDTLGNVARAVGGLTLPNLGAAGLGALHPGIEGVPAAAHTGSWRRSARSANTRIGWSCPKGGVPPAAKPVASFTRLSEARRTLFPPAARARLSVCSLRSPGTRASTAAPSTSNTKDLTIWLGRHPTALAASMAVFVPSGKTLIFGAMSKAPHPSSHRLVAEGRLSEFGIGHTLSAGDQRYSRMVSHAGNGKEHW